MAQVVDSAVRRCTTQARSEEIKALQLGMQMLGYEHHFRNNGLLLRVNGDLTERQAEQYDAALSG